MKNLFTKIAAPLLIIGALAGQPVAAENRNNINLGIGVFGSSNKEILNYYSGLFGGRIGLDSRISENLRFSTNVSAFTKTRAENNIESKITFIQLEPVIQYVTKEVGEQNLYCGIGLSFIQANEFANYKDKDLEISATSAGIVLSGGAEFFLDFDWAGFIDFSYRAAKIDGADLGGLSANMGIKYYFGENN